MPICQGTRSTQNAAMPLNLKDYQVVMHPSNQLQYTFMPKRNVSTKFVPYLPIQAYTYVLADGSSDLSGLGNGETNAWVGGGRQ
jgi:hypothetical protein